MIVVYNGAILATHSANSPRNNLFKPEKKISFTFPKKESRMIELSACSNILIPTQWKNIPHACLKTPEFLIFLNEKLFWARFKEQISWLAQSLLKLRENVKKLLLTALEIAYFYLNDSEL